VVKLRRLVDQSREYLFAKAGYKLDVLASQNSIRLGVLQEYILPNNSRVESRCGLGIFLLGVCTFLPLLSMNIQCSNVIVVQSSVTRLLGN